MQVGGKNTKALLKKSCFVRTYIQGGLHKTLSKERGNAGYLAQFLTLGIGLCSRGAGRRGQWHLCLLPLRLLTWSGESFSTHVFKQDPHRLSPFILKLPGLWNRVTERLSFPHR